MKLFHGTSYENALNICTTGKFIGGILNSLTYENRATRDSDYACELDSEDRVVYFTPNMDYAEMYAQNENDCIIVLEVEDNLLKSMLEIDKDYFYADEEFYIYEDVLNLNMKILGLFNENKEFVEDYKEWSF